MMEAPGLFAQVVVPEPRVNVLEAPVASSVPLFTTDPLVRPTDTLAPFEASIRPLLVTRSLLPSPRVSEEPVAFTIPVSEFVKEYPVLFAP